MAQTPVVAAFFAATPGVALTKYSTPGVAKGTTPGVKRHPGSGLSACIGRGWYSGVGLCRRERVKTDLNRTVEPAAEAFASVIDGTIV